jgi:hypothetical protein
VILSSKFSEIGEYLLKQGLAGSKVASKDRRRSFELGPKVNQRWNHGIVVDGACRESSRQTEFVSATGAFGARV